MHDRPRVPNLSLTRIALSCGRSVDLTDLRLSPTYGDMPHGYPCRPANDLRIRALLHTAAQMSPTVPVHLIPPPRAYPDQYAGAFGPVETLPRVACVGRFSSTPLTPAADPVAYRSGLTVIWFQPTPRIPAPNDPDPTLRDIDWPSLARGYELEDPPYGP
ncbi:hypothetical protein [Streptomyces sp. MH60]|uniref:hypothetical protein n=1 Tax=Streptomyces sp. MH60 TaxID=1940758 RepID=UPI000CEDD109|nr:hypothetical protein [Streptomyces sp. MH60]PPS84176.1 hypothetical protein BZZ08_04438 [Streptomyces sp. MH60]